MPKGKKKEFAKIEDIINFHNLYQLFEFLMY